MFSKKSDRWRNGNLINLKCKKLKTRKEKLELNLDKVCNLFEFKRVEFELDFYYVTLSSSSNLYTRSSSSSSSTDSDGFRV